MGFLTVFRIFLTIGLIHSFVTVGAQTQDEMMEGAESDRSHLVRVMVHKEFYLQPDGTYQEMPSSNKKYISRGDEDEQGAESSPPMSYYNHPYSNYEDESYSSLPLAYETIPANQPTYSHNTKSTLYVKSPSASQQSYNSNSNKYYDLKNASQVQDEAQYGNNDQYNDDYYKDYKDEGSKATQQKKPAAAAVQNETVQEESEFKNNYDYPNNVQTFVYPQETASHYGGPQQNYGPPGNIQDILVNKPEDPYYSPKDQLYYEPVNKPVVPDYGPPEVQHQPQAGYGGGFEGGVKGEFGLGLGGGYENGVQGGWNGNQGGGHLGGGIVGGIVQTVQGVKAQKAHQVQNVLQQTGHLGKQLLNSGGQVLSAGLNQKAIKAKAVGHALGQVPAKFSQVLSQKAAFASAALAHGGKKLATVVNIKANIANQASGLIAAKGKAATAVIKAAGGTTADIIIAKGKGIAHLINTGGRTAAAILDAKGGTVEKIADVLTSIGGNKGGGGYGGAVGGGYGFGGGWGSEGGFGIGKSSIDEDHRPYEELNQALKAVVNTPASSYGSPPQGQVQSAFQSIFDNFKAGQQQGAAVVGSYSSPSGVATQAPSSAIGDGLSKMSSMFNNVATVLNWLNPPKQ